MENKNTNYFTYESYMETKGRPYIETCDGRIYLTVTETDDKSIIIQTSPSNSIIIFDIAIAFYVISYNDIPYKVYIESSERIGGTLKVEPTETCSDKVKRVKKDAIDRIMDCIEVELDYVAKELGIDVDSICLNIESTQDVIRFENGHTKTQNIRTLTMDIKL